MTREQCVVFLATAQVQSPNGSCIKARALIDQGYEISFVSERSVQSLNLKRSSASVPLVGVDGNHSCTTRGKVNLTLSPIFDHNLTCMFSPYIYYTLN
jgi:hypothetical protein